MIPCYEALTNRIPCLPRLTLALLLLAVPAGHASEEPDREAVIKTGDAIRAAFLAGDVDTVMKYHHPDVAKALGFHNLVAGREAVVAGLHSMFQQFQVEFVENRQENLLVHADTAIEQTVFTLKGIPKRSGRPFLFRGRTMVVYVRYTGSPTGWATVREIIQPATD